MQEDASVHIRCNHDVQLLYFIEGVAARNETIVEAGWCGVLQPGAEPVHLIATSECTLLLATYD
jgi:hypothetical protein